MVLAQLSRHRGGGSCRSPARRWRPFGTPARLVWCFVVCFVVLMSGVRFPGIFSPCFSVASPLLSARCARAGRSRSAPCARCSGTVPAAPRAAPPRQLPLLHRALGPSQCPALAVRTTATSFHMMICLRLERHLPAPHQNSAGTHPLPPSPSQRHTSPPAHITQQPPHTTTTTDGTGNIVHSPSPTARSYLTQTAYMLLGACTISALRPFSSLPFF